MGRGFHLTIDEWFYHWFADENKYIKVTSLFIKIFEVCDKLVLKRNTRLAHKFYQLDEDSGRWTPKQRESVKLVKNLFLSNSNKIHWIDSIVHFPDEINDQLPRKDIYLVEICLQTADKIFVTSDKTLYKNISDLQSVLNITSFLVDDFIDKYLSDEI